MDKEIYVKDSYNQSDIFLTIQNKLTTNLDRLLFLWKIMKHIESWTLTSTHDKITLSKKNLQNYWWWLRTPKKNHDPLGNLSIME